MARQARWSLAGHAHHILIRGNNRQLIFLDEEDRGRFLAHLGEVLREHALALHAYVLMPDHVHLLATPAAEGGAGRGMQALGRRYVAAFNQRHGRTGTLWEGRYRAYMVSPDELLRCMRFIESSPQRGATPTPGAHASSLPHHLGELRDPLITDPAAYWGLGNTPFEREAAYRESMEQGVGRADVGLINAHLVNGRPLGNAHYLAEVELAADRSLQRRPRGRPRKVPSPQ